MEKEESLTVFRIQHSNFWLVLMPFPVLFFLWRCQCLQNVLHDFLQKKSHSDRI